MTMITDVYEYNKVCSPTLRQRDSLQLTRSCFCLFLLCFRVTSRTHDGSTSTQGIGSTSFVHQTQPLRRIGSSNSTCGGTTRCSLTRERRNFCFLSPNMPVREIFFSSCRFLSYPCPSCQNISCGGPTVMRASLACAAAATSLLRGDCFVVWALLSRRSTSQQIRCSFLSNQGF